MKRYEAIPSLSWMIIGILICIASAALRLGSWRHPEPGLFPFFIGCAIVLLSFSQLIPQILKKSQGGKIWPSPAGLKRIIVVFALLVFYALTLEPLGFIPCTFFFFVAIFKGLGQKSWKYAALTGLTVAVFAYVVFQIWLKSNLPRGPLGV
jgi:putative tricarboxylic transport membrane protein